MLILVNVISSATTSLFNGQISRNVCAGDSEIAWDTCIPCIGL